jgi:hypothetical protein
LDFSLRGAHGKTFCHPLFLIRDLSANGELSRRERSQRAKIGVVIAARQYPLTAQGFAFLAVKDSWHSQCVIVPAIYARARAALQGTFVLIDRVLQKDESAINGPEGFLP